MTASDDKSARIWDTATGEPLVPPIRHEGEVGDACFSPDGRLLFTALSPRAWAAKGLQGNIWESATGKFVTGPFGAGNSLQRVLRPFSPDSRTFVTVTPTTAAICDSSTGGQLVGPLPLDGYGYSSGEFSSNGERMVTCGMTARVWDARTGSLIREVKEDGPIFVAQLSPDGERLLTVSTGLDKTAQVWNATTGRALTGPIKLGWSKTTQFGPNAEWVITAGSGQVRLWKATTGELLTEPIRESGICWGELSADGERLVTCSTEGNARVWGIKMGQQAHLSVSLPVPEWIPEFVESLGGKRLTNTGHTEAVPLDQIFRLKSKLAQNLESNSWTLWAKWLLQLTVSPTASSGSANTTEIGKQEVANLLTNGSFELPVYAGDGDVVPSATEFGLPGWTFSPGAGVQHLILEYGKPYGRARYAEGRQAVLLNGDGCKPPIMLSQTFPTAPGHDYVLSFTQGDEEMAGPSNSELTVSVGGVRRVFSRTNDTGMVIKILHFKATSNLTTLTFEDTTPNVPDVFHSPFLDDVSVIQHETNGSTSTRR